MSALPGVRCTWCAKEQPANANLALVGVAVQYEDESWRVHAISQNGISDREWMVEDVAEFVDAEAVIVKGEGSVVIIDPAYVNDWELIVTEAGMALMLAREQLDFAMRAAEIVASRAVGNGSLSEAYAARLVGVDRMTVRKWLGK